MKDNNKEIISEGFWWSPREQHLPKVEAGKPFEDQGVLVSLMYLLHKHLDEHKPDDVVAYRGWSTCRICGCVNGSHEYVFGGYRWPSGYRHYIEEHNVEPSEGFKRMLDAAALWMAHPPIRYQIEAGVDGNVVCVQRMVASDNIVLLHISTRCKRPKVTSLGSDTIDDKDVPIVYLDTLDGADGDDTGIVLLEYAGWTVWSAQAVKYGVNVSLHSPYALFPKQEEVIDDEV